VARQAVSTAQGPLDLVGRVVDPALEAWVEHWYGLPGLGDDLLRSARFVTHAIFLNPTLPKGRIDLGGLRRAVDHLEAQRAALVAPMAAAPPGTVSHALLGRTGDPDIAAGHLLGLTVGPLALGSKALAEGLDHLLDQPRALDDLRSASGAEKAFRASLRQHPPLPGVLRHNPVRRPVQGGRRLVTVPVGEVLAATACPAHLGDDDPPDLVFSHGRHLCLGPRQITEVAGRGLWAVAARPPRRRPGRRGRLVWGSRPTGVQRWPIPSRLAVVLRLGPEVPVP
jgi:hypothetical protein